MKTKKKLIVDKKECKKCGSFLDETMKICEVCGYDTDLEEGFKIFAKKFKKILNEQKEFLYNFKEDPETVKPIEPQKGVQLRNVPKGSIIRVSDESEEYTFNPKKPDTVTKQVQLGIGSLRDGDTMKVNSADESKKKGNAKNPWAICTASVGRENKEKYEKCVLDIKDEKKRNESLQRLEEYIERLITDEEVNPKIKKRNFKNFISKLK